MARPKKNNADYFSHDADMRNDAKIKALRRKFGLDGYAVYLMLLEHLTDCDYFEFEETSLAIELIAGDFDIEPEKLVEIIDYLEILTLISRREGKIVSDKLTERFDSLLSKRRPKPQSKELLTSETPKHGINDVEKPQRRVKESKVNESKVNESKYHEREKDLSPFELMQKEKSIELESWTMHNRKNVVDFDSLIERFNNTAEMEIIAENKPLEFNSKMMMLRFKNFASSWIENEKIKKNQNGNPKTKEPRVNRQTESTVHSNSTGWDAP